MLKRFRIHFSFSDYVDYKADTEEEAIKMFKENPEIHEITNRDCDIGWIRCVGDHEITNVDTKYVDKLTEDQVKEIVEKIFGDNILELNHWFDNYYCVTQEENEKKEYFPFHIYDYYICIDKEFDEQEYWSDQKAYRDCMMKFFKDSYSKDLEAFKKIEKK